jgi:acetyl-CoA carboxylase biotin carboxylase subunit
MRINAEDPFNDFRPSPGKIELFYAPGGHGIRWDSHVYGGYTVPPHYDSMIGKLIAFGSDRATAMDRMSRALDEFVIHGIKTTVPIGQAILKDPDFRRGRYTTHFVESFFKQRASILPSREE